MWLKQCHKPFPKPPQIGAISTIPSHGWFMIVTTFHMIFQTKPDHSNSFRQHHTSSALVQLTFAHVPKSYSGNLAISPGGKSWVPWKSRWLTCWKSKKQAANGRLGSQKKGNIWWFPEIGVPLVIIGHPFLDGIFEINHPAMGVPLF